MTIHLLSDLVCPPTVDQPGREQRVELLNLDPPANIE
jgi:hypothetical protein